ncbi:unnamed protein product [Owenia fusiformis]|uniref:Uncharacterized protein n=1 Tax=Owenia fusiformis TaxID=6347 RepID=A0A8S4N3D1_OWEFU|nr:unnamed protein product [Owenia fusiformis]
MPSHQGKGIYETDLVGETPSTGDYSNEHIFNDLNKTNGDNIPSLSIPSHQGKEIYEIPSVRETPSTGDYSNVHIYTGLTKTNGNKKQPESPDTENIYAEIHPVPKSRGHAKIIAVVVVALVIVIAGAMVGIYFAGFLTANSTKENTTSTPEAKTAMANTTTPMERFETTEINVAKNPLTTTTTTVMATTAIHLNKKNSNGNHYNSLGNNKNW